CRRGTRAQDTFLAIEDALNRIVNQRLSANPADWHRSYCVLLFMEQLEKLVFNAYEGCALLSGLSHFKSVKYFFRTNKSTCLEWLHRTRPIVMQLCDRLDSPELVAREAFALLGETDASRYANQDDTLLLLVKSLCRMGQADCLHGLYAWCETRLGRRLLCLYEQHLQDLLMNGIGPARGGAAGAIDCTSNSNPQSKQTSGTAAYVRFCVTQIASATSSSATVASCWLGKSGFETMGEWSEPPLSSAISALPSGQPESGAVYSHVDRLLYSVATAIDPNQSSARASAAVVRSLCHGLGRARAVNWPTDLVPELYEPLAKLRMLALPCSDDNAEEDSFMQQQLDQVALNPITSREGLMSLGMLRLREAADRTALLRQSDPVQQRQHREMNFGVSLPTVRWCIRQSNFATAEALLLGEIDKSFSASADSGPDLLAAVESVRLARVSECDLMSLERAAAKLLWRRGQSLPGLYCLAAGMSRSLAADAADPLLRGQKSRLNAKSVLTLVKWIRSEAHSSLFSAVLTQSSVPKAQPRAHQFASVSRSLAYLCDLTRQEFSDGAPKCPASVIDDDSRLHSLLLNFDTDALVGKLLLLASKLCPLHAKAWHGLASWCYKEARRAVLDAANRKPNVELTQAEKETALSLLPATVTAEEQTRVLDILGQAAIESALRSQLPGRQLSERSLRGLQSVWRQCCQRVFALHHSSAKSYFTYLRLAATGSDDNGLGGSGSDQSPVVSATLRLLRLLVKHPGELADCLLEGFGDTPTGPWRAIIPQLFSRLSHPYPAVQQCLTELLIRIGADYPHLVVFPAIVGSSAPAATEREPASAAAADANPEDEAAPEDDQAAEAAALDSGVLWCVSSICDKMTAADPALLGQVRLFVDEMRRITVLWDELWLGAISQQLDDTARRVDQLDEELRRLATSDALSAADKQNLVAQKHEVFFMPILYTLERLSSITSVPAETPHETWFQATFSEIINETIDAVRAPSDPGQPHATWQAIKHLYQFLQQKIRRHSPNGAVAGGGGLSLAEISPALARLRATRVPMPGLGAELTLDGIQDEVQILPTKTKPKRLHFRASNGRLWLASLNAADWWRTLLNYSRSVAVMSIIGYVIGLGDRHLD
uniref:PI3K/PI4K domain-containing protein n=1 Tax=Macrostomum lignano TaxID=282301 RepID=A0A1I8IW13_9PLAT